VGGEEKIEEKKDFIKKYMRRGGGGEGFQPKEPCLGAIKLLIIFMVQHDAVCNISNTKDISKY